jgi:hypothetical protein
LLREAESRLLESFGVTELQIDMLQNAGVAAGVGVDWKNFGFKFDQEAQLYRRQPKLVLLLPFPHEKRGSVAWLWPELEVRSESSFGPALGRGVFATRDLRPGLCIPVLGHEISENERQQLVRKNKALYVFDSSTVGLIDGDPRIHPDKINRVGNYGLSIALMVNEPPPRNKANCAFGANTLQVRRRVAKGEELLVHYGDSYERPYKVGQRCLHTKEPADTRKLVKMLQDILRQAERRA